MYAARLGALLESGSLMPAHHAILTSWFHNLTDVVQRDEGGPPSVPPGVMIYGLPDEARLGLALLIAGDLLQHQESQDGAARPIAPPAPSALAVPAQEQPAAQEATTAALSLEAAKQQLRSVATSYPHAVLQGNLQAALESSDLDHVQNEIGEISYRATQRAAQRIPSFSSANGI